MIALHFRGNRADHATESSNEGRGAAFRDSYWNAQVTADRSHLRSDEAGADDQDALRPCCQSRLQTGSVIACTKRQYSIKGGLFLVLIGAALNLAPTQWRAVVAEVPFVDCLTTMLDPTLPLTITEWDEYIRSETLADSITRVETAPPHAKDALIGEVSIKIWIEKV